MASNRIFLGVDPTSNLAISLESGTKGFFYLTVTTTDLRKLFCRFVCSGEDLDLITAGKGAEMSGSEGHCTIHPAGDEIVFEFTGRESGEATACALSANSFSRVVRLAKSRAYVG